MAGRSRAMTAEYSMSGPAASAGRVPRPVVGGPCSGRRVARPRDRARAGGRYVVADVDHRVRLRGTGRYWFVPVTLGGFLGVLAPVAGGVLTAGADPAVSAAAILIGAAVYGGLLGGTQAGILRLVLPRLRIRRWATATAGGTTVVGAVAVVSLWAGGGTVDWPTWVQLPSTVVAGLVMVFAVGVAQWTVLRHLTDRAGLWITANGTGWTAGLVGFAAGVAALFQPQQSTPVTLGVCAVAGLAPAAVVAAVTGAFLPCVLHDRYLRSGSREG
ncbi:hypothetical protein [Nocardia mexicana]|uniref:Uncharacterized protein n=1 Tax=Nocardia mexicana TaxID=279262 RepID=A0A370GHQ3_9NOCA|nr:hypothetical protein [Nocardia mexicana]RDI43325.1 hypothetical protein DFR68_12288 [Nocardia mexicana]